MPEQVTIAALLAVAENAFWLQCIRRAEDDNPASLLNKYRKLKTTAPPITIDRHGVITDGRHRTLIALERGQTTIAAKRKT